MNFAPNGSLTSAVRSYGISIGSSAAPPPPGPAATTASASTTWRIVPQDDAEADGSPALPSISCPSGLHRKVKSTPGRSSFLSRMKSKTPRRTDGTTDKLGRKILEQFAPNGLDEQTPEIVQQRTATKDGT